MLYEKRNPTPARGFSPAAERDRVIQRVKRPMTTIEIDELNGYSKQIDYFDDVLHHSSSIPPYLPKDFFETFREIEELVGDLIEDSRIESRFVLDYIKQETGKMQRQVDQAKRMVERDNKSYIDMDSYALYKLLGKDTDDNNYAYRASCLKQATQATIYTNADIRPPGILLTRESDFPGEVYFSDPELFVVKIIGEGRLKEVKSYLEKVGIGNIVVVGSGEKDKTWIAKKIAPAKSLIENKGIDLSVMPVSTIASDTDQTGILWSGHMYGTDRDYQFEIITRKGKIHFVADIRWANGVLVKSLLRVLQDWNVTLNAVNLYGIAGSLIPAIPPGSMVVPRGEIHSLDPEHADKPVRIPGNDAFIPGSVLTMDHGNVSSILEETSEGVKQLLLYRNIHVVEMEAYHLVKELNRMDYTGTLKIVFKIHDVVTSPQENISIPVPQNAQTLVAKRERDKIILEAFQISKPK